MHLDNIIIICRIRCGVCLTLGAVSVHIKYAYIPLTLHSARRIRRYARNNNNNECRCSVQVLYNYIVLIII